MKKVSCPVARYPGYIVLSDPLTFPQSIAVEDAIAQVQEGGEMTVRQYNYALLPALVGCVEEWHLDNMPEVVTAETFPATPAESSALLVSWILEEVIKLYGESEEVPNA